MLFKSHFECFWAFLKKIDFDILWPFFWRCFFFVTTFDFCDFDHWKNVKLEKTMPVLWPGVEFSAVFLFFDPFPKFLRAPTFFYESSSNFCPPKKNSARSAMNFPIFRPQKIENLASILARTPLAAAKWLLGSILTFWGLKIGKFLVDRAEIFFWGQKLGGLS